MKKTSETEEQKEEEGGREGGRKEKGGGGKEKGMKIGVGNGFIPQRIRYIHVYTRRPSLQTHCLHSSKLCYSSFHSIYH